MNRDDLRAAAQQALKFCEDLQGYYWGDLETVIEDLRAALDVTEKATMNHDDIVRMAQECGLTVNDAPMLGVEHFANLVAAAEREACAQMFDRVYEEMVRIFHLNDPDHPWNTDETRDSAAAALYYAEDIRLMKHHQKPAVPIGQKS